MTPRWRYIHAQHAAFHEMMGDLQQDVSDMVILLEVAQGETSGSSGMLPPCRCGWSCRARRSYASSPNWRSAASS